jgi:hypothetical protein
MRVRWTRTLSSFLSLSLLLVSALSTQVLAQANTPAMAQANTQSAAQTNTIFLDDEGERWAAETLKRMTIEEKIG